MRANSGYIIEVSGKCGMQESPASNQLTLRTNVDLNFQCGSKGNIPEIANKVPLLQLQRGNFIKAGDFEVEVYQVEGVNGVFNGKGYVLVPLFNFIKLDAVLENVQVNGDFQLIGGRIRTIYDVNNSSMVNLTDIANKLKSDTNPEENDFAEIAEVKVNAGDSITSVIVSGNSVTVSTSDGNITTRPIETNKIIAIIAPEGQQYMVDGNSKTVYTSSTPGGGEAPKTDAIKTVSSEQKYTVQFAAHADQLYGFDVPPAEPDGNIYNTKTLGNKSIYLPWKSVESGRYDKLKAIITGRPPDSVFYSRNSASMVMTAHGTKAEESQLMITGEGNNDEDELFAWYRTYIGDSVKKQDNYLAGAVNVVSYDKKTVKLELVEVNDATAPNPEYIQKQLNSIYKQAVVEWRVTKYSQKIQVTFENDIFNNSDPDNDMDYTQNEKQLINKLKEDNNIEKDKLYLFIINTETNDNLLKGYMPFNRNFGFVFTKTHKNVDDLIRTIAHEPGHGAFRLRHTFSPKNSYIQPQFTTDNLMDYTSSDYLKKTQLMKYQWDECHDWDLGLNWGEGEEEGEISLPCVGWFDDCDDVLKMLEKFRNARINGNWIKLKGQNKPDEQTLTGKSIKVSETDFSRIRVIYKPENNDYSFDPSKYINYNQSFISNAGTDIQTGIAYLNKHTKEFFKILVDEPEKIENLKEYLFGSGINFEVESNGARVNENSYVTISAEPEMPEIKVKNTSASNVSFRLKIEYRRDIRNDEDNFPASEWKIVKAGESWTVDFGDKIRGGRATLLYKTGSKEFSFVFHIRGTNPTEQDVKNYINDQGYDIWFLTRLIRQESNYLHFNNGTNYGPNWENSQGCPNWGPPHGWGLMQLDLIGEQEQIH